MVDRPQDLDFDELQRRCDPSSEEDSGKRDSLLRGIQNVLPPEGTQEREEFEESIRRKMHDAHEGAEPADQSALEGVERVLRADIGRSSAITELLATLRMEGLEGTVSLNAFMQSLNALCKTNAAIHAGVHEVLERAVEIMLGQIDEEFYEELCIEAFEDVSLE